MPVAWRNTSRIITTKTHVIIKKFLTKSKEKSLKAARKKYIKRNKNNYSSLLLRNNSKYWGKK